MTDGGGLKGLELYFSSEKAEKAAERFRQAMEAAAAGVIHTGTAVDALDKSFDKLGRTTSGAAAPVGRTGEAASTAGNRMRDGANRARDFQKGLLGLGVSADTASKGMARLVTAAGGFFALRKVVTTLADTEDKLRILQSVTGATSAEMRKLSDAANAITINGRASFGEATQALIELGKAGASASASQAALADISNLSRAGLISMSEAAETVVNTYAQFGLTLKDSARISDVLVKAADSTTSSVGSLADSLAKVGPIGRELGVSFEEITAAVAILQQNGEKAQVAGTGLGRVLKQLADPANGAEGAAQAIRDLGLSFSDINPRDFARALDNLAASNLTLKQATALVGEEFDRILISLVRNRKEIGALGGKLGSAFGDAANKAAATVGTLGESMDQFNNAVERLILRSGDKGVSGYLKAVVVAGRDAINVLGGDAKAMKDVGTAGVVLANAAKGAAVALAGLATINTIGRMSEFGRAAYGAGLSVGKLWGVIRANPLGAWLSVAAAATTAFALFGDTVKKSSAEVDEFLDRTEEAKAAAAAFDAIRQRLLLGDATAQRDQQAALKAQLLDLKRLQDGILQDPGRDKVPAERIIAAIQNSAPEAATRLQSLIDKVERLREAGESPGRDTLAEITKLSDELQKTAGLQLLVEREAIDFGAFTDTDQIPILGFYVKLGNAISVVSKELNRLSGSGDAAKKTLDSASAASNALVSGRVPAGAGSSASTAGASGSGARTEREKLDAVQQLIRERLQEADLAEKSAGQQLRVKLLQDATNASIAAGRQLRFLELVALEAIAKKQDALAQAAKDQNVDRVLQGLRDENDLLQAQGVERSALRRQQEVLNSLAAQGVREGDAAYEQALKLLAINKQLVDAEEQRRSAERRANLFKRLQQDEEALRLVGAERDRYLLTIEAQNEAEQAGLVQGSAIYQDYVKRRQALEELAKAGEEAGQYFGQMGVSAGNALERIIIDGERARDVVRALIQDLARMAFQKSVTENLQKLLTAAGEAFGQYIADGSRTTTSGSSASTISPGAAQYLSSQRPPNLSGGIIPAMTGQIVAASSFLERSGRRYSVAEGGAVTPEAVFPLTRDARGRLSLIGAGGGGGENVTMIFPSVRNAQDARQVRATRSQIARRVAGADRSGRRGLRPRGE